MWNRLASHSYSIFFPMSSIVIPCICILFCYIRIFIFARKAKARVAQGAHDLSGTVKITHGSGKKGRKSNDDFKRSLKLAKGLFASFLLFTICWFEFFCSINFFINNPLKFSYTNRLPYGLVVMIDFEDKFPPAVHAYTMAIAHFNSSLNPVLYAVANPGKHS